MGARTHIFLPLSFLAGIRTSFSFRDVLNGNFGGFVVGRAVPSMTYDYDFTFEKTEGKSGASFPSSLSATRRERSRTLLGADDTLKGFQGIPDAAA